MNIELEITLRCNARCMQCERHCDRVEQADSDMTMDQIHRFIAEVRLHPVGLISVIGGEPTLHPEFEQIVSLLLELKDAGGCQRVLVATNGLIPLPPLRPDVEVFRVPPSVKNHRYMDIAPVDTGQSCNTYCSIPAGCGIALNAYGYFPCGAGGSIVRLLQLEGLTRYSLADAALGFDYTKLCKYCQLHASQPIMIKDGPQAPSPTFERAWSGTYPEQIKRF